MLRELLTEDGIMMSEGELVATNVIVEHDIPNNMISYSYNSIDGMMHNKTSLFDGVNPLFTGDDITGIISNKDQYHPRNKGWYIFWN